jgi:hypothetical protein
MPNPASSIGHVTISGPAPMSSRATMTAIPANRARKPIRTTSRGDTFGNSRGTPTAASSSVTDSGRSRTPVAMADRPRATDRYSGTTKNSPACNRYWNMNAMSPPRRTGLRSRGRLMSGSLPCAMRWSSQLKNSNNTTAPPVMSQITGDSPSHSGALGFGLTNPHEPERSTP